MNIVDFLKKIPTAIMAWFSLIVVVAEIASYFSLSESGFLGGLLYLILVVALPIAIPIFLLSRKVEKKPFYQKWWFWLIGSIGALAFIVATANPVDIPDNTSPTVSVEASETTEDASFPTETTVAPTTAPEPIEPATEAADSNTTAPKTTVPEIIVYDSGMYKVGTDIAPGEYFVTANSGRSSYVQVSSDSSGTLDSIVTNENVSTFFFISVSEGQYLTVKQGSFVKSEDAEVPGLDSNGLYGEGMYRVGEDIAAGEYKLIPDTGDSAYVEVTADSLGSLYSIVSNEYTADPIYITVEEGQYIKVSNGKLLFVD